MTKRSDAPTYKVGVDFSPGDAWDAESKYVLLRKFGSQQEADRRYADPFTRALLDWAAENVRPNPLSRRD